MSSFKILYSKDSKKFIKANKYTGARFMMVFSELSQDFISTFRKYDIERLKGGYKDFYRLRIGKYRAVFRVVEDTLVIYVITIDSRGDVYKKI
ncbi:MAG: type II toxin-antitoxin system mRNA interferase toxin, RelE/StbE family [Erysipelotrichaceae bacterium]|nr:type II toxin-antitoxin system mRNA interferase toxin, RelE/StbE family [Erysipelotrichaceae bacterium]